MTQPNGKASLTRGLVSVVIALALVNWGIWQSKQSADPAIDQLFRPEASTPARAAEPTVTVSRPGTGNTPPITLAGGAYDVSVTTQKACFHDFTLRTLEGKRAADLATTSAAGTAQNIVYGIPAGRYYVASVTGSGCAWTLTMTPR